MVQRVSSSRVVVFDCAAYFLCAGGARRERERGTVLSCECVLSRTFERVDCEGGRCAGHTGRV